MSKNLEELKWLDYYLLGHSNNDKAIKIIITILEDFEERLKTIEVELGIYTNIEEEIKKFKLGGTD